MTQQKKRRERLPSFVTRTAAEIERAFSYADEDSLELLSAALIELSNHSRVHVDHPRLAKAFFLEAVRAWHLQQFNEPERGHQTREAFDNVETIVRTIVTGGTSPEIERLREVYADDQQAKEVGDEDTSLAPVVDLNCWRQVHPRRINNLLFAERSD